MSWDRFKRYYLEVQDMDFSIDISRMNFEDDFLEKMEPKVTAAIEDMKALENGSIANPDEKRMVGHYWLRNPELAPTETIASEIRSTKTAIKDFSAKVHSGEIGGADGAFKNLLVIGIGGSALGPQFVSEALGTPNDDKLNLHFFDNTDPEGMSNTLAKLEGQLGRTITVVISKSGGTPETRNGMLTAKAAYSTANLDFGRHAVAITGTGSKLEKFATKENWLLRLPMWDWVGGRTSETGPVGLLPAALQGLKVDSLLAGARDMDAATREPITISNPAMLLALMWYYATNGRGEKDMVVLPYKDRLQLFSKYLQQLVMESLGKENDLAGERVNQGIAVYGNKGSTDQHAYVQQLREGVNNFFVTFIEVLQESSSPALAIEPNITSGDYLCGFLLGTREALSENERESITITIKEVSPRSVGQIIALFERAVGFYASFIGVNAYHQPGVEAGKKAAAAVLELNLRIQKCLRDANGGEMTAEEVAEKIIPPGCPEITFKILESLTAKPLGRIKKSHLNLGHQSKYRHES